MFKNLHEYNILSHLETDSVINIYAVSDKVRITSLKPDWECEPSYLYTL